MKPEASLPSTATPDDIRAEIERTRAHMDETLVRLGRKVRPDLDPRKGLIALAAAVLGIAGFILLRKRFPRHHAKRARGWRKAGLFEQALVMRSLIASARKGKPAIYVIEPRKT